MNQKKILLNETTFTLVCKSGFIRYSSNFGNIDLHLSKRDMIALFNREIVNKELQNETVSIAVMEIDAVVLKEIIKRSPVFAELYYEL